MSGYQTYVQPDGVPLVREFVQQHLQDIGQAAAVICTWTERDRYITTICGPLGSIIVKGNDCFDQYPAAKVSWGYGHTGGSGQHALLWLLEGLRWPATIEDIARMPRAGGFWTPAGFMPFA